MGYQPQLLHEAAIAITRSRYLSVDMYWLTAVGKPYNMHLVPTIIYDVHSFEIIHVHNYTYLFSIFSFCGQRTSNDVVVMVVTIDNNSYHNNTVLLRRHNNNYRWAAVGLGLSWTAGWARALNAASGC